MLEVFDATPPTKRPAAAASAMRTCQPYHSFSVCGGFFGFSAGAGGCTTIVCGGGGCAAGSVGGGSGCWAFALVAIDPRATTASDAKASRARVPLMKTGYPARVG